MAKANMMAPTTRFSVGVVLRKVLGTEEVLR